MRKIKVALFQSALKGYLTKPVLKTLSKKKPDFLVLPEYFFYHPLVKLAENPELYDSRESELKLKKISESLKETVIIGGSMLTIDAGHFYNTCLLYLNGVEIGRYFKQRLFEREIGKISTGHENKVFEVKGIKVGVLICADVFENKYFEDLKRLGADIVFIPTFSPFKKEKIEDKQKRDEQIFVNGARLSGAYIVKTCGVTGNSCYYSIQGRSLIADQERILWRAPFWREDQEILKITNLRIG